MLPPSFSLICFPLVSSRSQSVPRRTAPRGPIPAVSFGLGGKGVEVVEENVFFFFSLRSKEFKRCPSLSVLLWRGKGQKFGQGPGPCRLRQVSLAVGSHRSLLGASVGALLEVIFDLPSFPSRSPTVSFQSNQRKWKSKWFDSKRGEEGEVYCTAPGDCSESIYTWSCVCVSSHLTQR